MIKTSRQLKDLIRNLARDKSADAQLLMRNYMMERFLERLSVSQFQDKLILKGGMLVSAMVGLESRSTMDIDTTLKGATIGIDEVNAIINGIVSVDIGDSVTFKVKSIVNIMDEAEYPGIRVGLDALFDNTVTPLKIDISTGDAITPREIIFSYKLMLEERYIEIWAYNLETVLAEKLETVLSRSVANSRMRDFYDLYVLRQIYIQSIDANILQAALKATLERRGTGNLLTDVYEVLEEIDSSKEMKKQWDSYRKRFSYAGSLEWSTVIESVRYLFSLTTDYK